MCRTLLDSSTKKKRKKATVLLKLDVAKAFDSVSWVYLLDMLAARGFGNRWRSWIGMLLRSSSSQIMVNGHTSEFVHHHHGLRQLDKGTRCPLSCLS